jgi:hypothetical protein
MQLSKSEMLRVFLKRFFFVLLIGLPPELCLVFLVKPSSSTQILLFALVETYLGGSALIFSILLVPYNPAARESKASHAPT